MQSDSVTWAADTKIRVLRRVQAPSLEIPPASWGAAEEECEVGVPSPRSYSMGPKCMSY